MKEVAGEPIAWHGGKECACGGHCYDICCRLADEDSDIHLEQRTTMKGVIVPCVEGWGVGCLEGKSLWVHPVHRSITGRIFGLFPLHSPALVSHHAVPRALVGVLQGIPVPAWIVPGMMLGEGA